MVGPRSEADINGGVGDYGSIVGYITGLFGLTFGRMSFERRSFRKISFKKRYFRRSICVWFEYLKCKFKRNIFVWIG